MRPLFIFETPGKKASKDVLIDRIREAMLPELESIGLKCEVYYINQLGGTPIVRMGRGGKTILVMSWVRPISDNKSMLRVLNDYPRLNIKSEFLKLNDETKVEKMYELTGELNLYFLVMLQKQHENLFWFGKYVSIPKNFWETTYRKKGLNDRVHFPKYKEYNFLKLEDLKLKVKKCLKDENK